jgi:hypothetical protein
MDPGAPVVGLGYISSTSQAGVLFEIVQRMRDRGEDCASKEVDSCNFTVEGCQGTVFSRNLESGKAARIVSAVGMVFVELIEIAK